MEKERSTNQTNNQNANQSKQCKDKKSGGQWTRAKSFDTFSPIGPQIVLGSEMNAVINRAHISTRLNSSVMQVFRSALQ